MEVKLVAAFGAVLAFSSIFGAGNASALEIQEIPDEYLADISDHSNYKLTSCEPLTGEGIEGEICTGFYRVSDVNSGIPVDQCADVAISNSRHEEVFKSTYCRKYSDSAPLSLKEWSQLTAVKKVMSNRELKEKLLAPYRPPLLGG
jgi:hypothetical protein